jgi:acylphosphatase
METHEIEAVISGRVQLVMFRDFTKRKADSLGIFGTVKNLDDGTVCVVAQGNKAQLSAFIQFLNKGPALAKIRNVKVSWGKPEERFVSFNIMH